MLSPIIGPRFLYLVLFLTAFRAGTANAGLTQVEFQDLIVVIPAGWTVQQKALSKDILILGLAKGNDYVTLYSRPDRSLDMKEVFANGSKVTEEIKSERIGLLEWDVMQTEKKRDNQTPYHIKAFMTEFSGHVYYGYSRSGEQSGALNNAQDILQPINISRRSRSLTLADYPGKKHYLGWGVANQTDPSSMHNEVKYDVKHTHDIFTMRAGGDYIGKQLVGKQASASQVREEWKRVGDSMTPNDMFVQYSSGHGGKKALNMGITYDEIRDNALKFPAKEVIIFTMACHSGGLVDAFDKVKSSWSDWQQKGRTLFVMSSSTVKQPSATGPGIDPSEPGGPKGSAGSGFGHALWKALIGSADGYTDGVKDGFLSLEEIRDYTIFRTKKFGHTPVVTGSYNPSLIMNRIPTRAFVESRRGGTEGMSLDQIRARLEELNAF